jgi:hypothetical protein
LPPIVDGSVYALISRVEPCLACTLPVTFTKLRVHFAPLGTVTFPLMLSGPDAPPLITPVQVTSAAHAVGAPTNVVATAITRVSRNRTRVGNRRWRRVLLSVYMLFFPYLSRLEARSTIKGAPGILARILGEKALKQARIVRVRAVRDTDQSRNPVNANQRDEAACPSKVWGQPTLYTSPSNRSICGKMKSPWARCVNQLARAPALQQQRGGQMLPNRP